MILVGTAPSHLGLTSQLQDEHRDRKYQPRIEIDDYVVARRARVLDDDSRYLGILGRWIRL